MWNLKEQKIQRSTNVYFQENVFPFKGTQESEVEVDACDNLSIKEESDMRGKEESLRRSKRTRLPVSRFMDEVHIALAMGTSTGLTMPRNYKQMLKSSQRKEWEKAMKKEYDSLMNMGTWELVP